MRTRTEVERELLPLVRAHVHLEELDGPVLGHRRGGAQLDLDNMLYTIAQLPQAGVPGVVRGLRVEGEQPGELGGRHLALVVIGIFLLVLRLILVSVLAWA